MKLKEFNEELRKSTKFNIKSTSNSINFDDYLIQQDYKAPFRFKRLAFSAMSIVLVFVFSFYLYINDTPTTQLTIDINPSIEVGLNRFDRVVDITGADQESMDFIEGLDASNLKVDDLMSLIYQEGLNQGYFTDNQAFALVGVYGDDYEKELSIYNMINVNSNITYLTLYQHQENSDLKNIISNNYSVAPTADGTENYWDGTLDQAPEDITDSVDSRIMLDDLDSTQLIDLSEDLDISITKLAVVLSIYNSDSSYVSTDLTYLAELEISDLINLYTSIN